MNRRQAYEAAERRRALTVAGISTLSVVVALVLLVPLAPGWPAVRASFFDGGIFVETFPTLLRAFLIDIMIFPWSVPTIYLIGFGVPGLGLPRPWNSPYIWGTVALVLTYAAYVAEVLRSGIESVHASQRNAAICLGLSERDTMRFVILPQAIRRVVPANMNMLVALQKDVALLSFIGPVEILRQAGI